MPGMPRLTPELQLWSGRSLVEWSRTCRLEEVDHAKDVMMVVSRTGTRLRLKSDILRSNQDRIRSTRFPSPGEKEQPVDGHGGGIVEVGAGCGVQLIQLRRAR